MAELGEHGPTGHPAGSGGTDTAALQAFTAFYDRTCTPAYSLLRSRLGSPAAEEATRRVYLDLWRSGTDFARPDGATSTRLVDSIRRHLGDRPRA